MFLLVATPAHAGGGWVRARGSSYLELSTTFQSTDRRYDANGEAAGFERITGFPRTATYEDFGTHAYGELGLGKRFGVEGDVTWRATSVTEPASLFKTTGPADVRVLVKRGFGGDAFVWAVSLEGKLPLGYDETEYPSLGSGHPDYGAGLHAGTGGRAGYGLAEIGLRHRGGPAFDEWPFALQVGANVGARWQAIADLRGNGLLQSPGPPVPGALFDPATASARVAAAGPGVAFLPKPGLRIALQAWRTFAGANTPLGWTWKLAFARVR
jgi:hypothetical protein